MGGRQSSLMYLHFLILLIVPGLLFSCIRGIAETDTLNQSNTLNSTDILVSNKKNFTLGFFKSSYTNNTYLAIWYSNYPTSNPDSRLWIANRATPIAPNDSATLIIDRTGKLVINRTHGDPIPLCPAETATTTMSSNQNISAVLLDNGNLILQEVNSDGSSGRTLWQSFDCPTNTLLSGMKLGVNHITGKNWSLTSWLAQDDPSPGPFTLEWDPNVLQLVIRRRGVVFWTSGALKNNSFEHMSWIYDSTLLIYYHLMSTNNSDEEFFSYSRKNVPRTDDYTGAKLWLDYTGDLRFENMAIVLQDKCYGYNTDDRCAEWTQPQCRSHGTTFELKNWYFTLPPGFDDDPYYNESMGPGDCRVRCWNDCNCQAYKDTKETGCHTYSTRFNHYENQPRILDNYYVVQRPQNKRNTRKWIAISVPITVLLFVSLIVIIFYWRRKRKGGKDDHLLQLVTSDDKANELGYDNDFAQNLKVFSFMSIVDATNNFSVQNKLGQGGFGPVYKGKLSDGIEIAVKRLSRSSGQGLVEFKNELLLIAKLQHMNLVRLLGCSIQREEKMLVYEYMPNKSLDSFLFDASKRAMLDWGKRVHIIEGISQGLLYLHQHSRLRIIHRDLKASNILLDADMNPKISDFGMARIFKRNDLIANTNRIVGTYGYMSPEYAMEGIFSTKSDVFSFGVIILEILSGRKNNNFCGLNGPLNLVGHVWELWQKGDGLELMDPLLSNSCSTQQFLRLVHVGLLCVEDSPLDRPTTLEVISMITNESTHLPLVKKPAFMNLDNVINADSLRNDLEYHSINNVTQSTMNGR